MSEYVRDPASYRDPSGYVFSENGRLLRCVSPLGLEAYRAVRDSGALKPLIARGDVIDADEVPDEWSGLHPDGSLILEHPKLPVISYPYEWPFDALKSAALLHLDIQLELLERDIVLSDASAFNVQFRGAKPVFIDYLSFRPYRHDEPWLAHRQFCENLLNPLVLQSVVGLPYHAWLRGQPEGITSEELNKLLKLRNKLSLVLFSHVVLPAKIQKRAGQTVLSQAERAKRRGLPKSRFRALLMQLRHFIAKLDAAGFDRSTWSDYALDNTYEGPEEEHKRAFVSRFVRQTKPSLLIDLGCNTGEFSNLCLQEGAASVVGLDSDHGALRKAFLRSADEGLDFLPLYQDLANPSPDHGWNAAERRSLSHRLTGAQGVLALAVAHHLAIARNVPLPDVVDSIVGMAPEGVIEFVPKDDATVKTMLTLREDYGLPYDRDVFIRALEGRAAIVDRAEVSAGGRELFWYRRSPSG